MNVTKFATASRFLVHYLLEVCPLLFGPRSTLSPLDGDDFCNWAEVAPTPFLRSTMFLLAGAGETPPIQVIRDLADIHDVVALADPQLLCAAWVAKDTQTKDAIFQSLSLVTSQVATFRAVQKKKLKQYAPKVPWGIPEKQIKAL